MKGTYLEIDLKKIEDNAGRIVKKCGAQGIEVLGVTKGFSALPRIVTRWPAAGTDSWPTRGLKIYIAQKAAFLQQHNTPATAEAERVDMSSLTPITASIRVAVIERWTMFAGEGNTTRLF
jgi:tRNA(Leu) C34 or U34 (ribose-2'-O)-methylase TrmL